MRFWLGISLALVFAATTSWADDPPAPGKDADRPGDARPGGARKGAGRPNFAGPAAGRPDRAGPLARVFGIADTNKDGKVTLEELQKALEQLPGNRAAGANLEKLFQRLDTNGDGALSADEIKSVGGRRPTDKPAKPGDQAKNKPQGKGKNKPDKP